MITSATNALSILIYQKAIPNKEPEKEGEGLKQYRGKAADAEAPRRRGDLDYLERVVMIPVPLLLSAHYPMNEATPHLPIAQHRHPHHLEFLPSTLQNMNQRHPSHPATGERTGSHGRHLVFALRKRRERGSGRRGGCCRVAHRREVGEKDI